MSNQTMSVSFCMNCLRKFQEGEDLQETFEKFGSILVSGDVYQGEYLLTKEWVVERLEVEDEPPEYAEMRVYCGLCSGSSYYYDKPGELYLRRKEVCDEA